jgi:hypothetical protein
MIIVLSRVCESIEQVDVGGLLSGSCAAPSETLDVGHSTKAICMEVFVNEENIPLNWEKVNL